MKKYSINIKRVLINICILLVMFLIFNFISNFTFGNRHINTENIVVNNNDTLWNIASCICESSSEQLNIQNVVIQIKNINGLKDSNIFYGQVLEIPVYN